MISTDAGQSTFSALLFIGDGMGRNIKRRQKQGLPLPECPVVEVGYARP